MGTSKKLCFLLVPMPFCRCWVLSVFSSCPVLFFPQNLDRTRAGPSPQNQGGARDGFPVPPSRMVVPVWARARRHLTASPGVPFGPPSASATPRLPNPTAFSGPAACPLAASRLTAPRSPPCPSVARSAVVLARLAAGLQGYRLFSFLLPAVPSPSRLASPFLNPLYRLFLFRAFSLSFPRAFPLPRSSGKNG